jgi:phosphoglycerate kinase
MKINLINNIKNLQGKRVFVRIDANVKVGADKHVDSKEDFKLQRVLPTIDYLVEKGAIVILASHLGRPNGIRKSSLSLLPIAKRFTTLLGRPVNLCTENIGPKAEKFVASLKSGQVILLENLRFYSGEDKNDSVFAQKLARLADIYVNEAFAFSHRSTASMVAITKYLPCFAGFLLASEVTQLSQALKKPKKPLLTILGGAKISTKIQLVKKFATISDYVLLGGGLANNFLLADGYKIGTSLYVKKYLAATKKILKQYRNKILLPVDATVDNVKTKKIETIQKNITDIKSSDKIIDIGTQTVQGWSVYIKKAKTIIWNGPLGIIEDKKASHSSRALAELIAAKSKRSCFSVVGGGETVWLLQDMGIFQDFDYVSTGGGAMIEYLQGTNLPGLKSVIIK